MLKMVILYVRKVVFHSSPDQTDRRLYAPWRLILVNIVADRNWSMRLEMKGKGVAFFDRDGTKTFVFHVKSKETCGGSQLVDET